MRLIYLAPVSWHSFSQRPHKFVEWYHESTNQPVLWIEPYPTRLPQQSDFRRLKGSPDAIAAQGTLPPWLTLIQPRSMPVEPLPMLRWINGLLWRATFNSVREFTKNQPPLMVVGKPSALAVRLLKMYPDSKSLYDAMDNFPSFYSGLSRASMSHHEKMVAHLADHIWASSTVLKTKWQQHHNMVSLVYNGLDSSLIPKPVINNNAPDKKIFGYVGTIASWFDWDWVIRLASARPDDEIRLTGPVFNPSSAALPPNITLLPARAHKAALEAMLEFDVGLIPFKQNQLTCSVDPIKYYEYKALALPVISTNFGEMCFRSKESGVFISHSSEDIPKASQAALEFKRDLIDAGNFRAKNTWEERFNNTSPKFQQNELSPRQLR